MKSEIMEPAVRDILSHLSRTLPTNAQVCNWFRERPGAYVAPHPGIRGVILDGEVVTGVTACSLAEGWLIQVDNPPRLLGDYIHENIRFGKVELLMGGTAGAR